MPAATGVKAVKKLVLCFDGTGNTFSGTSGDTNIVKLYDKFNRDDPLQFHYYQTGIGTYDINGGSVNKGFIGSIRSSITRSLDQGFGTSFDHHVMAGYKFLMNHYNAGIKTEQDGHGHLTGDKIYMFGFSRGAYTARFLARMINAVGLLSMGNDEMVPFAYQLYQRYEEGKFEPRWDISITNGNMKPRPAIDPMEEIANEIKAFKNTFGRPVKVYFLGIFDCVNSVAVLDNPHKPPTVLGTATHVRHAVAVDEFRVKFKPALLNQDIKAYSNDDESVKEVWFPGNHGDVGGGWPILDKPTDWWDRLTRPLSTLVPKHRGTSANPRDDDCQMSDIPLDWMIRELELVNKTNDPEWAITFSERKAGFKKMLRKKEKMRQAKESPIHDTIRFGYGLSAFKVIMWNLMEYLPFISRYELTNSGEWEKCTYIPNRGSPRDIPHGAMLHQSLIDRISNTALKYRPQNNRGNGTDLCLLDKEGKDVAALKEVDKQVEADGKSGDVRILQGQVQAVDRLHRIYTFKS